MKNPIALFVVALCALPFGCSNESQTPVTQQVSGAAKAGEVCADCAAEGVAEATPTPGAGMGITMAEFTPISKILAAPADYEGKRLLVKGDAVGVCAKAGCWARLKSDGGNSESLFVKVMDGEIVFPMEAMGQEIVAEGILQKIVTPVERLRQIYAARAEAKGEDFDPTSITEPRTSWQLRGLGARWEI